MGSTYNADIVGLSEFMNSLTLELNPSAQRSLLRVFAGHFKL